MNAPPVAGLPATSATSRSPLVFLPPRQGAARARRRLQAVSPHDTLIAPAGRRARVEAARAASASEAWTEGQAWVQEGRAGAAGGQPTAAGAVLGGRYLLSERLGAGGFGVVWRAEDTQLHRAVAVKAISLPPGGDLARATREAHAAARLSHPAIVALYEARVEEGWCYLVSELVEGATLAELIAADALADEEVLEIGAALADALAHAHARGVVHRDLKPSNVLVPAAGPDAAGAPAKLTDFGGALLAGEQGLTRTGDVLGTLAYMAPEQLDGAAVDARADLYALALVLYEALTGVNPVRGPTPAATARRVGCALPPLERHRRDLPRPLTRALDRALDPDPAARGSLAELRDALADLRPAGRSARQRQPAHRSGSPTVTRPGSREDPGEVLAETGAPTAVPSDEPAPANGWLTLPRLAWLATTAAGSAWLLSTGRPGPAVAAVCAGAPLVAAVRRPGPGWLAPALAPVLGLAGLAAAYPALAGQAPRWRARALLGALGWWWLCLAGLPWHGSGASAARAALRLPSLGLLAGLALWALAAATLPWLVRGRAATLDALAAIVWAGAVVAATVALRRDVPLPHGAAPSAREVVLGAALGALLAVVARALRGPVATAAG
jgi:hypothetical protein